MIQQQVRAQRTRAPRSMFNELDNKTSIPATLQQPQDNIPRAAHPHVFDRWCDAQPLDIESSEAVQITLEKCIPPPIWLRIPITDLMYLSQQLSAVQLGFAHGIDQVVKWHDTTKSQFECTPLWSHDFFTDGSSIRDPMQQGQRQGASAIVLIVQTGQGLRWGGSRTFQVDDGPTAPKTEIVANW